MCDYHPEKILAQLADEIGDLPAPDSMECNRWIATSTLQKSVRRGETERAMRAAATLWQVNRQAFWRRLHILALEDVSIADPRLMIEVMTATTGWLWRRKVGDLRVALHLVKKITGTVKCRLADETYILAQNAKNLGLHALDDNALAGIVSDDKRDLIERLLSLWFIAGTSKFPSDHLPSRRGEPANTAEVLRTLSLPNDLIESCISVMGRSPWPLSIFMPLMLQEAAKHHKTELVIKNIVPEVAEVNGVPLYAADLFTRAGLNCFRLLRRAVPELSGFSPKQVGLAVFYSEGKLTDRLLSSSWLRQFEEAGEVADIEAAGMCLPSYLGLRETLDQHAAVLDEIRADYLQTHSEEITA